jgi:hypothetical protein
LDGLAGLLQSGDHSPRKPKPPSTLRGDWACAGTGNESATAIRATTTRAMTRNRMDPVLGHQADNAFGRRRVAWPGTDRYIDDGKWIFGLMRTETQAVVDDIKQSVGLLRRHL